MRADNYHSALITGINYVSYLKGQRLEYSLAAKLYEYRMTSRHPNYYQVKSQELMQ